MRRRHYAMMAQPTAGWLTSCVGRALAVRLPRAGHGLATSRPRADHEPTTGDLTLAATTHRWGRFQESISEDPWLNGAYSIEYANEPFNSAPMGFNSTSSGPPHVRPMGVHRTCGA